MGRLEFRMELPRAAATLPPPPIIVASRPRLDSIDLLRGIVMVLMALDHVRDFFAASSFNPRDVAEPALFLTRWITHFCAPVFIFLAGASAYLYGARGKSQGELSWFLFTRGSWLILLELTVVRVAWTFSLFPDMLVLQVIWAIGVSMITLAGLVYLPRWAIGAFAFVILAGHNLLDGIKAEQFGAAGWIWNILHEPTLRHPTAEITVFALYPLIPWIGVMAAGYVFAPLMQFEPARRRRYLVALGAAITLAFIALRATNVYGDPASWTIHGTAVATTLSFINNEKYPPSALYLAMTLGPTIIALAALEMAKGKVAKFFVTFGRTPLAFYVVHIFFIYTLAVIFAAVTIGEVAWLFGGLSLEAKPAGYGMRLAGVYMLWLFVVAALYLPCRWFAAVKQRRNDWWLSYL
ncbi:MAG: DUF1624 domain-containing protein [Burkholderiales bacterium]